MEKDAHHGLSGFVPKGRSRLIALVTAVMALAVYAAFPAFAVHDTGRFQLDGDAATGTNTANTPTATDDWDKVCYEVAVKPVSEGGGGLTAAEATTKCGIGTATTGATETAWTAEPNRASSIFTGGGSKDPQDLDQWAWKNAGGLPDKDNLEHGFAVRYSEPTDATHCPSGGAATCDLLYAGLDRFDNSGDAQNGVWFLQNPVTLGTNSVGGGTGFDGVHATGDILVVSDFSNGGTISTITIYTWDPACTATNKPFAYCADANLHTQETSANANCKTVSPANGDSFCGLVNPSTITMPWSFTDKSGTPNNGALNGEFYEEGLNLSALHLSGKCFSSVLMETRSSTSTTATLKDFILSPLGNCTPALTTQVQKAGVDFNGTVQPGTPVTDTATITVTGASTPDDATGTVDFFLCGPDASSPPDCSTGGTAAGANKALTDTSSPANTTDGISGATSDQVNTVANPLAPGHYCFRAEATLTNYASPDAETNTTTECFSVAETTSTSTAQNWLPNDTATVTLGSGGAATTGSVTFTLYSNGTCTAGTGNANVIHTFGPINVDSSGQASTNNSTFAIATTPGRTISWRVTYTSGDANIGGSTSHCETSTVTINDDTGS